MIAFLFIMLIGLVLWIYFLNFQMSLEVNKSKKSQEMGIAVSLVLLSILCVYAISNNEIDNNLIFHQQRMFETILQLFQD